MITPDYVLKIKIGDKLRVIGSGYSQSNGVIALSFDTLPMNGKAWLFPFEKRIDENIN